MFSSFWINFFTSKIDEHIFIFRSPRSGTTFLGEIINEIPEVSYYFEPPLVKYFARLVYENKVTVKQAGFFYRWMYWSLEKFAPQGGKIFVDKTPRNIFTAETLHKTFPNAKFIHIYRDGRDVTCSLLTKPWHLERSSNLRRREIGGYPWGPYPFFYIENSRVEEYTNTSDIHRCIWRIP